MKTMIALVILAAMATAMAEDKPHYDVNEAPKLFEKFIKDYNRIYKDAADREEHYKAFLNSLRTINEANAKNPLATFDINHFADLTPDEKKSMFGNGAAKP